MSDEQSCQMCRCFNIHTIRFIDGSIVYLCEACAHKADLKRINVQAEYERKMEVRMLEFWWSLDASPVSR